MCDVLPQALAVVVPCVRTVLSPVCIHKGCYVEDAVHYKCTNLYTVCMTTTPNGQDWGTSGVRYGIEG